MLRTLVIVLALTLCAFGAGCTRDGNSRGGARKVERTSTGPIARPSQIFLVSIDTLRADHLGAYGYDRPTSPNLDRFAEDSVLFENAFTTGGATLPTHISMLTSLPYHTHNVNSGSGKALDPERSTLAELLGAAGYKTAAFVGGGFVQRKWGFDQGFEVFEQGKVSLATILPDVFGWLETAGASPFFLFLHTLDVHSDRVKLPYEAPGEFRDRFIDPDYPGTFDGCRQGKCASELLGWFDKAASAREIDPKSFFTPNELEFIVALYDGGVTYADAGFGKLIEKLERLGIYEQSLIVVTADHGEEFLEHDRVLHHQNYDETARIPLMVKLPGFAYAGKRISGLVNVLDIMPTILSLAEVKVPPEARGTSLVTMIEQNAPGREYVYIAASGEKIRTPRWSLVVDARGPRQLFDLSVDPDEKVDVRDEHPDVVKELFALHQSTRADDEAHGKDLLAGRNQPGVELSEKQVQGLRALGYLQ